MAYLKCPICGGPTRVYMGNARRDRLCGNHADMLKRGEIMLNQDGTYCYTKTKEALVTKNDESKVEETEACKVEEQPKEVKVKQETKQNNNYNGYKNKYYNNTYKKNYDSYKKDYYDDDDDEYDDYDDYDGYKGIVKCIACGRETKPGFFFCGLCYNKYNNKELLVKICHCKEIEILDDSYEGHYTCDDGHIVKSKSERDIDNYLFENGIPHAYERAYIPDYDPSILLKPDFTLPNFNGSGRDVIIEHWGFNENNIEYTKSKNYKINIYKKAGATIVSTSEKDIQDYKIALKRKLATFEYDKINFDE